MATAISVNGSLVIAIPLPGFRAPSYAFEQPFGEPQRQQHPQQPERPAADHVARPVDAEHHPAGADQQATAGSRLQRRGAVPAACLRQGERERQVEDHRAGRVAAGKGRGFDHDQMRLERRAATARPNISAPRSSPRPMSGDREQHAAADARCPAHHSHKAATKPAPISTVGSPNAVKHVRRSQQRGPMAGV